MYVGCYTIAVVSADVYFSIGTSWTRTYYFSSSSLSHTHGKRAPWGVFHVACYTEARNADSCVCARVAFPFTFSACPCYYGGTWYRLGAVPRIFASKSRLVVFYIFYLPVFKEIRHRRKHHGEADWESVLFFGCRHRKHDFIYEEELNSYAEDRTLSHLHLAFSREQGEKVYVQDKINAPEAREHLWNFLTEKKGYFYVCG